MMDFNEAAARQIVRDLTYTTEVLNPTPGLHPLLPVGGGNVVTIPRLLLGPRATADRPTDWIGRLLRILERAPWRAEARKRFGEIRESLMQSRLERGMAPFAVATRRNIKIASAGLQVGDIDLLVFRPEERVGLALSLKWYYPPDLVQEGASQAARLTEAVRKHLHVMAVFQETYEQIRRSHDLPSDVDFRPVVVVQPGPVFERARNPQVAVLTGSDFLNLASTASSFGSFIDAVARYEPPSIALQPSTDASVHLGRYTFRIPTYFIAPSERKRFGFDFAPGKPGMPWDLP
jgi:hypothetical protein